MSLDEIIILALVQGFSAVLPVSAWTHVLIARDVLGWFDPAPAVVFAAHAGTLLAFLLYLWRDIWLIVLGLIPRRKRRRDPGQQLAANLAVASMPILVGGLAVNWFWGPVPSSLSLAAWLSILFGVILYAVDRFGMTIRRIEHMTAPSAFALGLSGMIGLLPGASRVGIVVLAARALGYERRDAMRFSFMLSIPIMIASSPFGVPPLGSEVSLLDWELLTAAGIACLASFAGMASVLRWVSRERFTAFAVYRIALGIFLLYWLYG
ncbi:MAG: undecaprenyl-diphosphate phosphatase [Alphaproteobacteria bacterium]